MRILLTGATGFLGTHLLKRLEADNEVFVLTRSSSPDNGPSSVNRIQQDLARLLDYSRLPGHADVILHLAQSKFYKEFPERAQDIFDVNTRSTLQLLEYGRKAGINRFIFASSGGVYGFGKKEFVETDPIRPTNFYLDSKCWAEAIIWQFKEFFDTTVLRPFFVYGVGQDPTMLIPRLVRSVLDGTAINLQGADGIRINPVYVVDAAQAFERALAVQGDHIINVGGAEVLSLRQIGQAIGEQLGRQPLFETSAKPPMDLVGGVDKMRELLCTPRTLFRQGIARVCAELKANDIST